MGVLDKIPTCLTVCVLVMIFACLKRHTRSARLTLWAVGWTMVSIHFLAQLLEPAGPRTISFLRAIDAGALQLAAVVFLVSVSSVVENLAKRTILLTLLAVPCATYAVLEATGVSSRWPYCVCLIACFTGAGWFFFSVERRFSWFFASVTLLSSLGGALALRAAFAGSFHEGAVLFLGLGFALPGVFICRNYWAKSPAVLTMCGGFFCWGASFPLLWLAYRFALNVGLPSGLWDTPKLFVAFGMILAVVEDKSKAIVGMQLKAEALNRQLERFSAITSRLLSNSAPEAVCQDITSAITELTSFKAAVINLENQEGMLWIAGSSGTENELLAIVQQQTQSWTASRIQTLCSDALAISKASFFVRADSDSIGLAGDNGEPDPRLRAAEIVIPLFSASRACLGAIRLAAPSSDTAIHIQELARIESLASDLAVAIELKSLHTQLVWSEKLAAMGQLVAGVAHELNNPLTAIMGFGELMGDAITSSRTSDQLKKMMSETRRMKRITDNLLRFSRQSSTETHAAQLAPIVHEVLTLCEYYTRTLKVSVETEIAADLPLLAINEDEIKQVLLNLFNNSCDALQGSSSKKKIKIRAYRSGTHAVIQVEDSGPGFSNLNRALDPFFTTKPVGKGTGLGLSICQGIAKRRGGDLRIENVKPHGGRVTLEIPVVETHPQSVMMASAHA